MKVGVRVWSFILPVMMLILPGIGSACTVCMGNPEAPMIKGVQAGMLVLLGFIAFMLVCFAMFFLKLRKGSRDAPERETAL